MAIRGGGGGREPSARAVDSGGNGRERGEKGKSGERAMHGCFLALRVIRFQVVSKAKTRAVAAPQVESGTRRTP